MPSSWIVPALGVVVGLGIASLARADEPSSREPTAAAEAAANPKKRFVDHGAFVEDVRTGLLWQKDGDESGQHNFYDAARYASRLELGGLTDWRVPTAKEFDEIFPAVDKPFVDTKYTREPCCGGAHQTERFAYWTSDLDKRLDDYAYVYQWYAAGGANNCFASKNLAYVRCVHDPLDAERKQKIVKTAAATRVDVEREAAKTDAAKTDPPAGDPARPVAMKPDVAPGEEAKQDGDAAKDAAEGTSEEFVRGRQKGFAEGFEKGFDKGYEAGYRRALEKAAERK